MNQLNNDIAQNITDKILSELEKGVDPWVKPWKAGEVIALLFGFNGWIVAGLVIT